MIKKLLLTAIMVGSINQGTWAQFAPPAGQPGSTAIYKDSSVFVNWASQCIVNRGLQDISDPGLGFASVGADSSGIGKAGTTGVVSLGDGGTAELRFPKPIVNGPGPDFAVFENAFDDHFLELAHVEVSSDGNSFFRFPSVSNTQTSTQVGGFDSLDARKVRNLAGKYRANYGVPFDLEELKGIAGLDLQNITMVRIIDVVGSINMAHGTYDSSGTLINDPWPTPFASGGFDLDAVGVINEGAISTLESQSLNPGARIYPNPWTFGQRLMLETKARKLNDLEIISPLGISIDCSYFKYESGVYQIIFNERQLIPGVYQLIHYAEGEVFYSKITVY